MRTSVAEASAPESVPASELRDLAPTPTGLLAVVGAAALSFVAELRALYSVFVRTL